MSKSVSIYAALRLPSLEIEALTQGRAVVAMPQVFIHPGRQFALYPSKLINSSTLEKYYRSNFLPLAQTVLASPGSEKVLVKAWATCELCTSFDNPESLNALSQLTMWTVEALKETFSKRSHILLAYLRVYSLPEPIEVPASYEDQFVALPNPLIVPESSPVLSKSIFEQRKQQLVDLRPPLHPELEELQAAIDYMPEAKHLNYEIRRFLGWSVGLPTAQLDPDLAWIKTIAKVGNSSDGHTFEKLVRRSLIKLGFTNSNLNLKASLDPDTTGGAGGLDFYCEKPYSVVGECKASRNEKIPSDVCSQLTYLGQTHLKELYEQSVKLIIAAGPLTDPARGVATGNKMNVIRPETLQSLVELQSQHKGSINLLKLKECFGQDPFGLADDKVNIYINQAHQAIKVRSRLVQAVKEGSEPGSEHLTVAEIRAHYNAKFADDQGSKLDNHSVRDLLVELSSPLTGYLGREKGNDGQSDRFYFLRDLPD